MRSARQSAIRVLQLMMVASVVLPAVLFAFASWLSYRHEHAVADDRIERSLDILHEQTLKVFQTVERAIAEVDEVMRGMPDDEIRGGPAAPARAPEADRRRDAAIARDLPDRAATASRSSPVSCRWCPTRLQRERPRFLQCPGGRRCRHLRQRVAGPRLAGARQPVLRSLPPPRLDGRLLQRRHRGRGAADTISRNSTA